MKVITKSSDIDQALVKLMRKYKQYYIAVAWASIGSNASEFLIKNKKHIKRMVVGTHFYQTHPDFIEHFIDSERVKFILKTDGVYHPKAYLFFNSDDEWECIIGSANFTKSALSKNSEVVVHIKSIDVENSDISETLKDTINEYWLDAESIRNDEFLNYKKIWQKNQKRLNSLKGKYGKSKSIKPLSKSSIFSLSWSEYFQGISEDEFHSFEGRIRLLQTARDYFHKNIQFSEFDEVQRREMAGIATKNQTKTAINWGWFGSMVGAGKFQNRINNNNQHISDALNYIPLNGNIFRADFIRFCNEFQRAFPDGGAGVAIASRLIAMKRPDYFVCLDKQNKPKLSEEFGIPKSISFEAYWDEIIERIIDSVWWSSDKPVDEVEAQAWMGRGAMLDAIFYEGRES